MMNNRLLAAVGCMLLLAGCRSEPIHYHTLVPAEPAVAGAAVQIEQVNVPPQVDRSQIVLREGESGLAILETEWWGASLADELHSALQNQFGGSAGARPLGLRVEVQRFDSALGRYALMDVRWRLRTLGGDGGLLLNCRSVLKAPASGGLDGLVAAHQRNVHELAQQVGRSAENHRCP